MTLGLPVLDLSRAASTEGGGASAAWRSAAVDIGCFGVTGHGIPASVVDDACDAASRFHQQDHAAKARVAMSGTMGIKGYLPDDFTEPTHMTEGRNFRDYASFDLGRHLADDGVDSILLGPNRWPAISGFREAVLAYFQAVEKVAALVTRRLAAVCGLDPDHVEQRSGQGCSLLRLLHYPRPTDPLPDAPDGHTDYEWLTIVWQSSPGLELLGRDGTVLHPPDDDEVLVVIVGDLLEVLSRGYLESTLHWVWPRRPDRYSLTFFYGPDIDEVVTPVCLTTGAPAYPAVRVRDHLTALRVRHLPHLRAAHARGHLDLPFELPATNPLKAAKVARQASRV